MHCLRDCMRSCLLYQPIDDMYTLNPQQPSQKVQPTPEMQRELNQQFQSQQKSANSGGGCGGCGGGNRQDTKYINKGGGWTNAGGGWKQ